MFELERSEREADAERATAARVKRRCALQRNQTTMRCERKREEKKEALTLCNLGGLRGAGGAVWT